MINPELTHKLTFIANQLGGMAYVDLLPEETLERIVMHEDDTIIVGASLPNIQLYEPDLQEGYKLYNSDYKLVYSHNAATGLTDDVWGKTKKDLLLIQQLGFGEVAFLRYKTKPKEIKTPRVDSNRKYIKDSEGKVLYDITTQEGDTRIILLVRV